MTNSINLSGQWVGHFVYGPEYGEEMHGEKVLFRLFLDEFSSGQFKGTSVDVEGFAANLDTAIISGYLENDYISFTKEYPKHFLIDDGGNKMEDFSNPRPRLSYSGYYDSRLKKFSGQWELWANEELAGEGSNVEIFTGSWEMTKDN